MTDSADEVSAFLHHFDTEGKSNEASCVGDTVQGFLRNVCHLFMDKNAHELGFTRFVLDSLKAPQGIELSGQIAMIGGEPEEEMKRIIEHWYSDMQQWVKLMSHIFDSKVAQMAYLEALQLFQCVGIQFHNQNDS